MTKLENLFEEAIEKEALRQRFLDFIDLGPAKPFIKTAVYSKEQEHGTNMKTVSHFLQNISQ